MGAKQTYVFAYDIADDRRRYRVSGLLEDSGVRVQLSVFEVRLTQSGAAALAEQIKSNMVPPDQLRVYPITAEARRNCIVIGGAPVTDDGDFYLF